MRRLCGHTVPWECPPDRIVGRHGYNVPCPGHRLPACHKEAVVAVRTIDGTDMACAEHVDEVAGDHLNVQVWTIDTEHLDPMADVVAAHVAKHLGHVAERCPLCAEFALHHPTEWAAVAQALSLERKSR